MKYQNIYNRLRRIEGQIRGIEDMLAKERGESDIIIQLEAVKSSVSSAILSLLETTLRGESRKGKVERGEKMIQIEEEKLKTILRMIKK
jgi:DNA-binding FrmR family transcriptional regulator